MRKALRVAYTDQLGMDVSNDYLYRLLSRRLDVELSDRPELLFFSVFGRENLRHDCVKVFYVGENVAPNPKICDYSFSFAPTSERNFQFPNFARYPHFQEFRTQVYSPQIEAIRSFPKTDFCNFIYSDPQCRVRNSFCKQLMHYKRVDCPAPVLNNAPRIARGWRAKLEHIKRFRFTMAFENESAVNYTTEKIFHAFLAGSVPIYWGNPRVSELFNPESFINCHDYDSFDAVIERIMEIDRDDELYERVRFSPPIPKGSIVNDITDENLLKRLETIVAHVDAGRRVYEQERYRHHANLFWAKLRARHLYTRISWRLGL